MKKLDKSQEEQVEDFMTEVAFELALYARVAGTDKFEVVTLDENVMTVEEFTFVVMQAQKNKAKLLYRISNGKTAIVYSSETGLTGVMPEDSPHGFPC